MRWKITGLYVGSLFILSTLLLGIFLFTFWYSIVVETNIPKNETSRFPEQFTLEFEKYITINDGKPVIHHEGEAELKTYDAWLQILDENGNEIAKWFKPEEVHDHYTPSKLIFNHKYANNGYTIFIGEKIIDSHEWSYIIGFPESRVSKYTILFSPENIKWSNFILPVIIILFSVIIIGYLFGKKLSNPLWNMINGIMKLAQGDYQIYNEPKGIYKNIYQNLNTLANTLQSTEKERKRLETMRKEWLSNLSHDIKTPLSSIKGYGELLSDEKNITSKKEVVKYANIMMNKAIYIETLLDDLKLTYQLKHHMLPLSKEYIDLIELLRTIVIDILNNPIYENREVFFDVNIEKVFLLADSKWLTRAFHNLLYNALIHNPVQTTIWLNVNLVATGVEISLKDNGKGIPKEDIEKLFERYYRGTNTDSEIEGTGLGMAIAKQIITSHEGEITVESELNEGTTITVFFPKKQVTNIN